MNRNRYLVTYDISSDKRRNRVFDTLQDHGDHTQFSVFICELDPAELQTLRGLLIKEIHHREDQILILDLGPAHHELAFCIDAIGAPLQLQTRAFVV
jgi:CRISPR-associated protein Cas2